MTIYWMKLPNHMILWSFIFFNKNFKPLKTKLLVLCNTHYIIATSGIWFTCNVHTYIIVYFYCVSFILRFCKRNTFEMKWIWKHLAQTNSWGIFLFFVVCDFVKMMLFCRNIFKWILLVLLVWYIGVGDWFIYFCVFFINVLLSVFSIC